MIFRTRNSLVASWLIAGGVSPKEGYVEGASAWFEFDDTEAARMRFIACPPELSDGRFARAYKWTKQFTRSANSKQ